MAGPVLALRGAAPLAGAAGTAVRVARVAGNALDGSDARWLSGRRPYVTVRERRAGAGARLAELVAQRDDVLAAGWDQALNHIVVRLAEDAIAGHVTTWLAERAGRVGVDVSSDPPHPGDTRDVRAAASVVAIDTAGLAAALAAIRRRLIFCLLWTRRHRGVHGTVLTRCTWKSSCSPDVVVQ